MTTTSNRNHLNTNAVISAINVTEEDNNLTEGIMDPVGIKGSYVLCQWQVSRDNATKIIISSSPPISSGSVSPSMITPAVISQLPTTNTSTPIVAPQVASSQISNSPTFTGPLSGWANVMSYGAKGDGVTDDTAAIQSALNIIGQSGKPSVLYLPAGQYKISQTLNLKGAANVTIVGANPSTVSLNWAGASGGTMLNFQNTAYSNLERVTLNGNNTAGKDLWIQWDGSSTHFPTTFGITDDVFKNSQIGIQGGSLANSYQDTAAEVSIERSQFLNNTSAGIYLEDWNTVDWWIRNSNFQNNYNGINVATGAFHVYNSNFVNSTNGDISANNNGFMGLRNNYSSGSPYFYKAGGPTGSLLTSDIENNKIVNTLGTALQIENPGPATILNNIIQNASGNTSPAVSIGGFNSGSLTALGNTFTVANPIQITGTMASNIQANNSIVNSSSINTVIPRLPATPPLTTGPIINVTTLTGAAIQTAINQAVKQYSGQHPIVHLITGSYLVSTTISIPTNSDVQVIGDVAGATNLNGTGFSGPIIKINGPSSALVKNLGIDGGAKSQGIVISGADQAGGKILLDQVTSNGYDGSGQALNVTGLNQTVVNGINDQLQGTAGINVVGGNNVTTASVNMFGGSNGPSFNVGNNGNLLVQDNWYENGNIKYPVFNLTGSGNLTLNSIYDQYYGSPNSTPNMNVNNFTGKLTVNNSVLLGDQLNISGSNPNMNVLVMNSLFKTQGNNTLGITNTATGGTVSFQGNALFPSDQNTSQVYPNSGNASPAFISSMLGQITQNTSINPLMDISTPVPSGTTDIVLQGLHFSRVTGAISITN